MLWLMMVMRGESYFGRSKNTFFVCRDWVKVVEDISIKCASFVVFQYLGDRKFKLSLL
ncbi:putative transcription factor B3-Domain family [Helianthus anomalus]